MKKIAVLLLCGLAVSGCTTVPSKTNFETGAAALAGSKRLRSETTEKCIAHAHLSSPQTRHNVALLLDVKDSEADRAACTRMINAVASGRLSYEEVAQMRLGHMSPRVVRILQQR
ncbi:hypothetical protein [Rhizobium sp. C1]|uniref:hypothetical protein n=1 Tax=Rhizobium sp. C1 TaxID=1349799 RepID=UPI001E2C5B5A|nr:hypothetical protein [Rhizobium sp. C1]